MADLLPRSSRGAVPADARRHNRSLVLSTLLHKGPLGRADLAAITGITKASMTDIVGALVAEGIVSEGGTREESRIGRPAILLSLERSFQHVISIDLSSHQSFDGAVMELDGTVVTRSSRPLGGATGDKAFTVFADLVAELEAESRRPLVGLAVGTPGRVLEGGRNVEAPALGWHGVDLLELAAKIVDLPCLIENDANLAAVAERRIGGGADDLLFIRIGRGVGAGVLIEGRLQEGQRSIAGEIGHVTVGDGSGPICACGRTGCLEAWIAVPHLAARIEALDAQEQERELAIAGERLGIVLAPVVASIDTSEIVVSGPADLLDGSFRESAEMTLRRRTLPGLQPDVPIRVAGTRDAVLLGAAVRLVERELGIL